MLSNYVGLAQVGSRASEDGRMRCRVVSSAAVPAQRFSSSCCFRRRQRTITVFPTSRVCSSSSGANLSTFQRESVCSPPPGRRNTSRPAPFRSPPLRDRAFAICCACGASFAVGVPRWSRQQHAHTLLAARCLPSHICKTLRCRCTRGPKIKQSPPAFRETF